VDNGHDFATKYTTVTQAVTGGILKIVTWAYLTNCQFIWQTSVSCGCRWQKLDMISVTFVNSAFHPSQEVKSKLTSTNTDW